MAERESFVMFLIMVVILLCRLQLATGQSDVCNKTLGMESGYIPDGNIVASTRSFGNNRTKFGPYRARLNSSSGYRADPSAVKQTSFHFIRVILPKEMIITGIATKGLGKEWVTKFKLMTAQNEKDFVRFIDNDTLLEKEFDGNSDGDKIKFNRVPYPVKASEILIIPTHWHRNIALRFELYGCQLWPGDYFCQRPLGMENGDIPDHNIDTVISSFGNNSEMFGPQRARLGSSSGYRADPSVVKQTSFHYINVKLPKEMIVTAIRTQGLGDEWVTKYQMMAGQSGKDLVSFRDVNDNGTIHEKEFEGNTDGDSTKFNTVPFPVITSEVLVVPTQWHKNIALRFELYGCEPGHYFRVSLGVLNAKFMLSYMDREDFHTKVLEEKVLYEVTEYVKRIPGYLSVELHQFSLPFSGETIGYNHSLGIIAEFTVHCIESSTDRIWTELENMLNNQGKTPTFGSTILQVVFPVTEKCQPPAVTIDLSKNPRNATLEIVNSKARWRGRKSVAASLNPECKPADDLKYSWEIANVDKESGMFAQVFLYQTMSKRAEISLKFVHSVGLHYIRCLAMNTSRLITFRYDFGFIETVFMSPLNCEITPNRGKAFLDKFTLRCNGRYDGKKATGYTIEFNSSHGSVVISNWRPPNGTIRLPAGNPVEDYSLHLKVEAKFLSLPSLDTRVVAKVTKPTSSDIYNALFETFEDIIKEWTYNMSFLQFTVEQWGLSRTAKTKMKMAMMSGIMKRKLKSLHQLKEETTYVVDSNSIKENTSQEMQNMSLQILEKAVNFLNEQRTDNISNISSITETLLKGAALIVDKASEDAIYSPVPENETQGQDIEKAKIITTKAVETIRSICEMRSRFLRNNTYENTTVTMDMSGVFAVSLAKVNTLRTQAFRLKGDEIHVPVEYFTGEWKRALYDGSMQVIRFEKNPYSWADEIITRNLSVVDVIFLSSNGTRLKISNLHPPIRIVFSREPQNNTDEAAPDRFLYLKRKEMRVHSIDIPSYEATIIVRIKPEKDVTLRVYVKKGSRPTGQQYDLTLTLCSNVTKKETNNCSSRDPYELVLAPNATGYVGRHFIGIKIQANSSSNGVIEDGEVWGTETMSCVTAKPPPTTPPPRKFNSKTDVKYTFYATVGTCVFWDALGETWSSHGCQVAPESNDTGVGCLTNHLTAFSGQFYVAPNKLDLHKVFNTPLPPENVVVLCTVCLIFAIYAVGLLFARKADNRDKMKIANRFVTSHEQEQTDGYSYEVSIQTGMWYKNGTTARVGIQLYGEESSSDIICFMDPWQKIELFTRGSENTFTLNLPVNLGQLYKMQIWHDNSGTSPCWFLYQVVVKDISTNEKWHFVANRWLAVEKLDGEINVEVKAAAKSELQRFKSLFQWRAVTNFADKHLFLSLFTRPPQNPFTRCQRLTCLLSIIMVSLVTNAMFYRNESSDNSNNLSNTFQLGPLELSLRQIVIGVQCGLISLPVNIVTVMIFRNIKQTIARDSLDTGQKQTQGLLPPCFIAVGWVICLLASISSGFVTVFYSILWGAEVSNPWLLSVGISVLQDIVITGPIIIIINTSVASLLSRKQTTGSDVEIAQKGNLVFHGDGEVNIQQPSEEELQRMRNLGRKRRKMYRFFTELAIYITFVVLLMTVCYGNRKTSRYRLTKSLNDTFSGFYKVEDPKSFWNWTKEELVPGLYDSLLYNGHAVADNEAGLIRSKIGFTVGLPRIRQIRIKPESTCRVFQMEPWLSTHFKRCLSDVSDSNKDTTPLFKPRWTPLNTTDSQNGYQLDNICPEPWRYKESSSLSELLLSYGGGGFIAKLGYQADTALKVIHSIETYDWMDDRSAAVIVEFVVFEPANLLLTNVMFVFERFSTGFRRKTIDVVPVYIFPSSGSKLRLFYQVCILLWSIITLVLVVLEIMKVYKLGCVYFKSFFNWVSFLQLLSSACAMLLVFLKDNDLRDFLRKIHADPFGYWSVYELVKWQNIENVILSITVVMTTVKGLKLIQINRHVYVMKSTLKAAYRYLCSFFFIVVILALAFAELGTLLFGTTAEEYSTLYYALSSVFQMAIGIGKMRSKLGGGSLSQLFAPIFLMVCMLSLTIVFTDTFIAILDEAYRQASSEEYTERGLGAYIKQSLKEGFKGRVRKYKTSFLKTARKASSRPKAPKNQINPRITGTKLIEAEPLLSYESLYEEEDIVIQTIHRRTADGKTEIFKQTKKPKLAKTESLLTDDVDDIQSGDGRTPKRNIEIFAKNISDAIDDKNFQDKFPNANDSRYKLPPTEEDLLMSDTKEAMEDARSELAKYLCNKNRHEYARSRSSFSSSDDSWEELGASTSLLSLFDYCQSDSANLPASNYASGSPEKNPGNLTLNVLRRYGHTYIEMSGDSYV